LESGESVVLLEDIATTGGSALAAVEALRDQGAIVERALVVVDRQQGATETLGAAGVELASLVTAEELLEESERDST
jgi:orotate phosphoribosyltransferase